MANIYVSSGTSFSATISITYPAGSTCTVSNYKKTWTAPNTSGSWAFKANEVGYYTVKAVSGDKSKEEEILITAEGQVENVVLGYRFYLFNNGYSNAALTGDYEKDGNTLLTVDTKITLTPNPSNNVGGMTGFTNVVDMTNYSTLCFEVSKNTTTNGAQFGVFPAVDVYEAGNALTQTISKQTGTILVDISALGNQGHIGVNTYLINILDNATKYISGDTVITAIWLE